MKQDYVMALTEGRGSIVEEEDAAQDGAGHNTYEMLPSCVELVHTMFEECLEILE